MDKAPQKILYIECGITVRSSVNTGIQRVVKNIALNLSGPCAQNGYALQFVAFDGGKFYEVDGDELQKQSATKTKALNFSTYLVRGILRRIHKLLTFIHKKESYQRFSGLVNRLLLSGSKVYKWAPMELSPKNACGSASVLVLLDSNWDNSIWKKLDAFRSSGGKVSAICYDLIPFTHPETVAKQTRVAHTDWWGLAPKKVDAVMCISKSVRDDFLEWQRKSFKNPPLSETSVGYFYLGAEFSELDPVIKVLTNRQPYFLMVGSIEPRKNQAFVLDAFERLWDSGSNLRLVLVGAHGWKNEDLLHRIKKHTLFNENLFLIQDATDRDLVALYQGTQGLIMASKSEGFGLPIIEANRYGAKVIVSDIPVFREVVGLADISEAFFFDLKNSNTLCEILSSIAVLCNDSEHIEKKYSSPTSWKDSAHDMIKELGRVLGKDEMVQKEC